jgi:hypothetical protein
VCHLAHCGAATKQQVKSLKNTGAGEGNRTPVFSLEGFRRLNTVNVHSDKSPQNPPLSANGFPSLSERSLVGMPGIFRRDDGAYEIGLDGAGPFPTRGFAERVAAASIGPRVLSLNISGGNSLQSLGPQDAKESLRHQTKRVTCPCLVVPRVAPGALGARRRA